MQIELTLIELSENKDGSTTFMLGVPKFIRAMTFTRMKGNVLSCCFIPEKHIMEITMRDRSRTNFEIDFQADFDVTLTPLASMGNSMTGTFNGMWDGDESTDPKPMRREIDFSEITKQISTGSAS